MCSNQELGGAAAMMAPTSRKMPNCAAPFPPSSLRAAMASVDKCFCKGMRRVEGLAECRGSAAAKQVGRVLALR